jgi:hypothetical protein
LAEIGFADADRTDLRASPDDEVAARDVGGNRRLRLATQTGVTQGELDASALREQAPTHPTGEHIRRLGSARAAKLDPLGGEAERPEREVGHQQQAPEQVRIRFAHAGLDA